MKPFKSFQLQVITSFLMKNARRFSALTLLLFVALGAVAALSLMKLKTEYNMKQFLPAHHSLIEADNKNKVRFQLPDHEPFVLTVSMDAKQPGNWLQNEKMDAIKAATDEISKIADVGQSISIGNLEGASSSPAGLTVGKLVELTPQEKWAERILKDPILVPQVITADARTFVILVNMNVVSTERAHQIQVHAKKITEKYFAGATIRMGGIPVVQSEMNEVLTSELKNFLGLSLIASIVTLALFFTSFSSIVIPLILMVLANLVSLAWMAWTGVSFTVLSTTLPVLVSITVVSMAAHTMLRYSSDWNLAKRSQENPNPIRVLLRSYRGLFFPNLLTAMTTAIGFLALGVTNIPLIRQYGLTVGFSIFICWLVVILALFPMLILFPVPSVRHWTESRARWALLVTRYGKQTTLIVSVITGFFLWHGKTLNWSARLFDDLPAHHHARTTTEFIDNNMGGMIPYEVVVNTSEDNYWNDPAALAKMDELVKKWRTIESVGLVIGPQDFLRAAGRVQGKDLPHTRQEAAEYGFLYAFGEDNPLKKFMTTDGRASRIGVRFRDIPADHMEVLKAQLVEEAKQVFPQANVTSAGMATTVHILNNELCIELIYGFWQALVVIGLLLWVAFRNFRWTIASIIPNLISPAILLGALSIMHTPIKPGIALIFSIALGISFDNTVYLLGRMKLLKERSKTGKVDVAKAWYQEGNLCFFSSMALSSGFLVFLASYFTLNQQFGGYMLVSILGGLLGDLILLPAMLKTFPFLLGEKSATLEVTEERSMDKAVAAGLAVSLFLASSVSVAAVDPSNAKELLKQVEKNVSSNDEVATMKMVISEPDGTKKDRGVEIRRKGNDDKQKVLVKMNAPADLKGTSLLSVSKGKESDQWLYLPSSKQTRRILSSKKNSSFMDSELSYEDMGTSADANFESKVLRQEDMAGRKFSVVENTPKGDSSYGKILIWVDLGTYLVGKMEYYDKGMKLLKVSTFSNYKQFDKGVWRAQKVVVSNVQTKRGTILELSGLSLNKGLDDAEFTESALTEGD